ncbi:DUF1801 domain-containing protein [Arthrobacter crusticola]|uniref:DUF1801 domain-containing protein n=1 Tax=Arthrobacter crusticola TaxID=2547960 RepID=A0A4R5TYT9_9MICC|nr:DUF1801 domain-containing protein [Arthrobacter crusticola]TDK26396.1 DUF1801 domain-containing protein [Arthrobacter crusticola]
MLLEAAPGLEQRVFLGWQTIGFVHASAGYVCGLFPRPGALLLTFEHGARLPDPGSLLIGDGRQVRSLPISAQDDRTKRRIVEFLDSAILLGESRRGTARG